MLNSIDCVFRLQTWTVYRRKGKFYITTAEKLPAGTTKGYKSLRHACTAIARKLEEEFTTRSRIYESR
ncbi:MAG: hypothetical protein AB7G08_32650 [Hyphomicrobiaceae bacterium]